MEVVPKIQKKKFLRCTVIFECMAKISGHIFHFEGPGKRYLSENPYYQQLSREKKGGNHNLQQLILLLYLVMTRNALYSTLPLLKSGTAVFGPPISIDQIGPFRVHQRTLHLYFKYTYVCHKIENSCALYILKIYENMLKFLRLKVYILYVSNIHWGLQESVYLTKSLYVFQNFQMFSCLQDETYFFKYTYIKKFLINPSSFLTV